MIRHLLSGVALMGILVGAQGASAQTAIPASPVTPTNAATATVQDNAAAQSGSSVEDIVVTATRRSVDVQKVPISIEAVSASTLKAFNVTSVLSLPTLVSGLVVTPSGGNNVYLRGIGSPSTGFNESQVAVYIDGLYLANPTAGIFSFNNIDRVEVLKGPQGTLYGRNATGGLISIITRDPGDKVRIDASVGYASYNTLTANLYASAPLSDNLAANIAVYHQKQSQGWSVNVFNGHDLQKGNETGLETKLLWRPGANTKITASFVYDYNNRDYGYAYETYPGTLANDGTPYLGKYRSDFRSDPSAPTNIYIGSLKIQQDLGFANFQSLSGYQNSYANVSFAGGNSGLGQPFVLPAGVPANPAVPAVNEATTYTNFFERNRTFSEELQLVSKPSTSRFDWVLGAFYYNDHTELRLDSLPSCTGPGNTVCGGSVPQRNDGFPRTVSGSVFADGTYRIFDATHVTAGLRYTAERKSLMGTLTPLPGYSNSVAAFPAGTALSPGAPYTLTVGGVPTAFPGIPTRLVFHRLTYRFVLAQDIGDNVHLFASHNLGFKSGAFNGNGFNNPPVQPELLYATEAGIKSEFLDRRVRLNASFFHYTYNNVQVRSMAPPAPLGNSLLVNAARELVNGVDVDASVVPVHGLTINGAFEYLHASFANFPGTVCPVPGAPRADPRVPGGLVGTVINVPCNLAGATPQFSPRVSATIGAVYNIDTDSGSFSLSANDHYVSSTPTSSQYVISPAHHMVDASIGWTAPNKRIDAQMWVRNLTNVYTYVIGQVSSSFIIAPGAPRTIGGTIGFHY